MRSLAIVVFAVLAASLGACSVKEERTTQPTASAPAAAAPAATTTSKTYSLF